MKKIILFTLLSLGFYVSRAQTQEQADSTVYTFAWIEIFPEFPGGQSGWVEHLQKNLQYPEGAIKNNIEGRVILQFVVEKDGSLTDIKVLRGIGNGCDEEAIRVLQLSPKWEPGVLRNGITIRCSYVMPIVFELENNDADKLK